MRSKVILFCALLFCSKFVGSVPFGEESGRQRAYQQNNWQGNENNAGQYHGNDFARTQNSNSMTNSAQQYTNGQSNQERQYNNNYGFNNHPSSLQSLPTRNNPENFGSSTNERRSDGFQTGGDNYSIRNQNQPIRTDNQYGQQNWQSHNQLVSSAASAISHTATVNERPLNPVPEPYHNSGQHLQLPQVSHQNYQGDGLYPGNREIHYHPLVEKPGVVKYMAHSGSNFGTRPGNVHYENFNVPHAHNINIAKPGNNVYPGNPPLYSGPGNSQVLQGYNRPSGSNTDTLNNAGNSYNNGPIIPINTGYNNANNENVEYPIISSGHNNYNEGHAHNINIAKPGHNAYQENSPPYSGPPRIDYNRPPNEPINTRYNNGNNENLEKPIIPVGTNNYPSNNYAPPSVPSYSVLNDNQPRYFNNPIINSGPNDQPLNNYRYRESPVINPGPLNNAPVNTFVNEDSGLTDTVLYDNASNDEGYQKPRNDNEEPFIVNDTPIDGDTAPEETYNESTYESESSDSYSPGDQVITNEQVYRFSEGESIKDFFLNKLKKHFFIIYRNGTTEYVYHSNTEDKPNYVVVKNNDEQPHNNPYSPHQPYWKPVLPSKLHTSINSTATDTSTTASPEDDFNKFIESLSYKDDDDKNRPSKDDQDDSYSQTDRPSDDYYPHDHRRSTTPSSPTKKPEGSNLYPYNNPHYPHQPYWKPVLPSKLHTSITSTNTAEAITTASPEDDLNKLIESLSYKDDDDKNRPSKDDQDDSYSQTDRPGDDYYPHDHRRSTTPSSPTKKPEGSNLYPYNNPHYPHQPYWKPVLPSKLHTSITSTNTAEAITTASPEDDFNKFIESLSYKDDDDKNRPPKDDQNDSPSQTDRPSDDYYAHDHRRSTTPSSPTTKPEGSNHYPYNHHPHHSYWNYRHQQVPPKPDTSTTTTTTTTKTTTTPSPEDRMIEKFLKFVNPKYDKNRPPTVDQDDSSSQTDRPSDDFYPHDYRRYTTPSSRSTNTEGNNYYPYNPNRHNKYPPKGQYSSTTDSPGDNDGDDDVKEKNRNYDSPKLITKISPGIYRSTTPCPKGNKHYPHESNPDTNVQYDKPDDNSSKFIPNIQLPKDNNDYPDKSNLDTFNPFESQMHHFLDDIPDIPRKNDQKLPIISTRKDDKTTDSRDYSSIVPISPTKRPVDELITISPIELATDNVKDGSTPSPLDEGIFDNDNLDAIKYQSILDEVKTPYYSSTPIIDQNDDNTDNVLIPIPEGNNSDETVINTEDIVINDTKSACNDSFTNTDVPAKSDDNKAAVTNRNDVNTDDTSTGDNSLESEQTSGLTLRLDVPTDFDDTLYIKIDVPDSNTGNEDESNDDTVHLQIKQLKNNDTDSTKSNIDQTNEANHNKNMMLDLTNALVVTNGTTDKDYLHQLLSGDSKVNLFVFTMPCQEHVLIEKSKHTTLFCNGTCLIETTETTWKTKDDPSPSVISTKMYSKGEDCCKG